MLSDPRRALPPPGPVTAEDGGTPSFAQLFFYDPEYATDVRMDRNPTLDRTVLLELLHMLTACNPFIDLYKTARERLAEPASSPISTPA